MRSSTIASPFAINMLEGAKAKGLDINQLLVENDISPEILDVPGSRITFKQMSSLGRALIDLLDDEYLGLTEKPQRRNAFKLSCYSTINSETIGEVIGLLIEFNTVMESDLIHELILTDESVRYQIRPRPNVAIRNHFVIEHNLLIMHRTLCWMSNTRIPVLRADFDFQPPEHQSEYRYLFYGAPVNFDQNSSALTFPAQSLNLQNVRKYSQLHAFLKLAPFTLLSQIVRANDLPSQLGRWLERQLIRKHTCPGIDSAALQMELHPQALRRELHKHGTSFQQIKMETRRDTAINLILEKELSVEAVAFQLGFSEPSAFIRSFKRWTGLTPLAYRKLSR